MTQEQLDRGLDDVSSSAPLRAAIAYDGRDPIIGAARDFTGSFLTGCREAGSAVSQDQYEAARLVVSELVTNACRHAPGPCTLDLALADDVLTIAVGDTSRETPVAQTCQPERVGRHGLEIVMALCDLVDHEVGEHGKTVRARLRVV